MFDHSKVDSRLAAIDDCIYRVGQKAVITRGNTILFVMEKDDEWWGLPGGGIDYGETPEQGLLRELAEEIGIKPDQIKTDLKVVHVGTGFLKGIPKMNLFYRVSIPDDFDIKPTKHVIRHGWFTLEEVKGLYTSPSTGNLTSVLTSILHA